jgi:hypothetical protein
MKTKEDQHLASKMIDDFIATVPRARPWFNKATGRWEPGRLYITKKSMLALCQAIRRARAAQAFAELDAEIAREEAAERRRARRRKGKSTKNRGDADHPDVKVRNGSTNTPAEAPTTEETQVYVTVWGPIWKERK